MSVCAPSCRCCPPDRERPDHRVTDGHPPPSSLPILYRDTRFAVIDKPAGMPVHPSRFDPSLSVEAMFPTLGRFRAGPWLAHRLDRDTSGCLVVALRRSALLAAQACFAEGRADKTYWALVEGAPRQRAGVIASRLGRVETPQGWRMAATQDGRMAETEWRCLGRAGRLAWMELRPRTGRTHQLRVHCAALGCPIIGDAVYGTAGGTLALLARAIRLELTPVLQAEAPPPPHMREGLAACGLPLSCNIATVP